jgi:hypothetical protein
MTVRFGKILLYIVSVLIISLVIFVYISFNGTPWGKTQHKEAMLNYLSEKYSEEFSIERMRFNPLGSGYYATAASKKYPDLEFDVSVSGSTEAGYADLYPSVLWNSPVADPFKKYILALFPDLEPSQFTVDRQLEEEVGPHIPMLDSLNYDQGYQSVLRIYLKENWYKKTSDEQKAEMENIQKIADYFQSNHFPVMTKIYYATVNDDYNNRKAIYITENGIIIQQ